MNIKIYENARWKRGRDSTRRDSSVFYRSQPIGTGTVTRYGENPLLLATTLLEAVFFERQFLSLLCKLARRAAHSSHAVAASSALDVVSSSDATTVHHL